MNDALHQEIKENPIFRTLIRKRGRFAWLLSLTTLTLYISFIMLIAFAPQWLGMPMTAGSSITRGIPIGIGLILSSFLMTGIYVLRANSEFDRLTAEILREVKP